MTVTNLAPKPPANSTDISNRMLAPAIPAQSPEPFKAGVYMLVFNGTMGAEAPIGDGPGAVVAKMVQLPTAEFYWSYNDRGNSTGGPGDLQAGPVGFSQISFSLPPKLDKYLVNAFGSAHVKINGEDIPSVGIAIQGVPCFLNLGDSSIQLGVAGTNSSDTAFWEAEYWPENQLVVDDNAMGPGFFYTHADNFLTQRIGHPNRRPVCSNMLTVGFNNPDKNISVEYLLGAISIFKFCARIDPAPNYPIDPFYTVVLSRLQGVTVNKDAVDIRVESPPLAACPGY